MKKLLIKIVRLVTLLEKKVRTEENIELIEEMILNHEDQPGNHTTTPADIARETNIDRQSVSGANDQDLGFLPLTKRKVQKFTNSNVEKHMFHSRKVLSNFTQKTLQTAFFSDEKIFNVKKLYNSHNDVVHVPKSMWKVELPQERLFCETEAFPKQIMVSVEMSKVGKTSIFFVESNTKVEMKYYCNVLLKNMICEMNRLATHKEYLFMQAGARAYTAKLNLEMLKEKKQELHITGAPSLATQ